MGFRSKLRDWERGLKTEVARRELECAELTALDYAAAVGRPFPPASRPGQYPRKRTGTGQDAIEVTPKTVSSIIRAGYCRVVIRARGWYLEYLRAVRGRRGLQDIVKRNAGKYAGIWRRSS